MKPVYQISMFQDELGGWAFKLSWGPFFITYPSGAVRGRERRILSYSSNKKGYLLKGQRCTLIWGRQSCGFYIMKEHEAKEVASMSQICVPPRKFSVPKGEGACCRKTRHYPPENQLRWLFPPLRDRTQVWQFAEYVLYLLHILSHFILTTSLWDVFY